MTPPIGALPKSYPTSRLLSAIVVTTLQPMIPPFRRNGMIPDFEIHRLKGGELGIEALSERAQKAYGFQPDDRRVFVMWHEAVPFVEKAQADGFTFAGFRHLKP
jgi:hypothetical protein